jgi:hypothetical protein
MNNYVYIIAGLPDFTPDWRQGEKSLDEVLLSFSYSPVCSLYFCGFPPPPAL